MLLAAQALAAELRSLPGRDGLPRSFCYCAVVNIYHYCVSPK
ncbi:MAG TPA: hypothetical protein VMK12_08120 [Anaeromyxobacteraceae bacterium]|nr:hypothetical protein [Anaeromyxobacteraceae bacterium]